MAIEEGGEGAPVHDLDRALALLAEGAALLGEARTWSRSQEEIRDAIARVTALAAAVEAGVDSNVAWLEVFQR